MCYACCLPAPCQALSSVGHMTTSLRLSVPLNYTPENPDLPESDFDQTEVQANTSVKKLWLWFSLLKKNIYIFFILAKMLNEK